jgi:hypothetical protein
MVWRNKISDHWTWLLVSIKITNKLNLLLHGLIFLGNNPRHQKLSDINPLPLRGALFRLGFLSQLDGRAMFKTAERIERKSVCTAALHPTACKCSTATTPNGEHIFTWISAIIAVERAETETS